VRCDTPRWHQIAPLGVTLLVPASEVVAGDAPGGFSLFGAVIQMLGALGIVIGIIALTYGAARKWIGFVSPLPGGRRYIRVIETRYVAPRHALLLVEVGGKYLLIGSSPGGVSFLREIEMLEEIEVLDDGGEGWRVGKPLPFSEILSRLTKRGDR